MERTGAACAPIPHEQPDFFSNEFESSPSPSPSPSALAARLRVTARTIYDLRRQGHGDAIEVLLGTALRIGEERALASCDIADSPKGLVHAIRGTVVLRTGHGAVRRNHPKTEHSIRRIVVPEFAAAVLSSRLAVVGHADA